jgi:hypothetical protein
MPTLSQRDTMLLTTSENQNAGISHLFIVLTSPNKDNKVLIINITSSGKFDEACIVTGRDHSFINKRSYVSYRYCEIMHIDKLEELTVSKYNPINEITLKRIIKGLYASKNSTQKNKSFYTNYINQ